MNTKFIVGVSIVGGLLLGGCQKPAAPPTNVGMPNKPGLTQTAPPGASAKPAVKSDTDEVKAIENDLNSIDASKDFPDFSANDLQQ